MLVCCWAAGTEAVLWAEGTASGKQTVVEAVTAFVERSELAGAVMGQRVAASQSDDAAPHVGDVVVGADNGVVLGEPEQPITVRMLLSHASGLPFRSPIEVPTLDRFPLAECVRSYAAEPLPFQPATAYQYSNAGINTAARNIEVVSGMLFER